VKIKIQDFYIKHNAMLWNKSCEQHRVENTRKIKRFFEYQDIANRYIDEVKEIDVDLFIHHINTVDGLADSTCNRYIAAISGFFKLAVKYGYIKEPLKIKQTREIQTRPRFFTDEEINKVNQILDNSRHPYVKHFFTLGLETGMRKGEILSIGLDKEECKEQNKTYGVISKDRKIVHLYQTKNGHERIVPINKYANDALISLRDKPSLFYTQKSFYNTWRKAKEDAVGNDDNFVFHVTRHTCATTLANDHGVPTVLIAEILGHRSMDTTKRYVHGKQENLSAIMNQLGGISNNRGEKDNAINQ